MKKLVSWILVAFMATFVVSNDLKAQTQPETASQTQINDGERWFNLMAKALNTLNFEASFVYVQGARIEPYQWVHSVGPNGRQFEWLQQMNGPGFRALRIDDVVSHFYPAANSYSLRSDSVSMLIPSAFNNPFSEVAGYYRAVAVGGARILDRKAQHIRLISRDDQRYGFSIWIDRDSGMPLKVVMVNQEGEAMEQIQLTNLSLRAVDKDIIQELEKIEQPPMLSELQAIHPPQQPQQPRWAPRGFSLLKKQHHRLVLEGTPVDHYLFSDGLAEYSVYLAEGNSDISTSLSVTGPHTLYSQPRADITVTVVGQIPLEVAKQVASSVQ